MAEAKGTGGGGGGHGDVGGISHGYQALLAAVQAPSPQAPLMRHGGLIHHPMSMPLPYAHHVRAVDPSPPPPPMAVPLQPTGCYQDGSSRNHIAAPQIPRGFADWRMCDSAFMTLAQATADCNNNNSNNNGFYNQNFSPCSANSWPSYMLKNPCCSFGAAQVDHPEPFSHENDSAYRSSFSAVPSALPVSPFNPMSPTSNSCTCMQILSEASYANRIENSEDSPAVFTSTEMESENSEELDHAPVGVLPNSKQGPESQTTKLNCKEYRTVLRKELTNSDVGNIGRIVLPKKDAEANLPPLFERDGILLQMDDLVLPITWKFKYRFWPNNKSRMYILETTGEFVKTHGLQAGDVLVIYKSSESGKFVIRGEKSFQQKAPSQVLECSCKKQGVESEACGFAMTLQPKKT